MNLDDYRIVFVLISFFLIICACVPLVTALLPTKEDPFLAVAVLGENKKAESYYPSDDPHIEVGEKVHWFIYLHNHMGELKYVALRVKLANSTFLTTNSISCNPNPAPIIYEVRRILLNNETWLYPFTWSIQSVESYESYLGIRRLTINDRNIETWVIAKENNNYRIIFELWVYDENIDDFQFGWRYRDEMRCALNQIWFYITLLD